MSKKPKDPIEEKKDEISSGDSVIPPVVDKSNDPNTSNIDSIVTEHHNDVVSETAPIPTSQTDNVIPLPKKRGRPFGSKNRNTAAGQTNTQKSNAVTAAQLLPRPVIKALNALPYAFIAKKYGDHWNLEDVEAESLVDVSLALANKYLPDVIKENPELYAFCIMHGMIVFAKMELHYRLLQDKKKTIPIQEQPKAPKTNEENNSVSGQDGLRKEFSGFGLHDKSTTRDNL